ncbi:hypothetical protein [Alcanivorax jadensis]|uniref:hypothetical protein n=1 Tax=Alcanivorax jadensis TaxID=64988 RepID=UPI002356B819|nr:hypothetical protein [Alcanivorax jadensis]
MAEVWCQTVMVHSSKALMRRVMTMMVLVGLLSILMMKMAFPLLAMFWMAGFLCLMKMLILTSPLTEVVI